MAQTFQSQSIAKRSRGRGRQELRRNTAYCCFPCLAQLPFLTTQALLGEGSTVRSGLGNHELTINQKKKKKALQTCPQTAKAGGPSTEVSSSQVTLICLRGTDANQYTCHSLRHLPQASPVRVHPMEISRVLHKPAEDGILQSCGHSQGCLFLILPPSVRASCETVNEETGTEDYSNV